MLLCLGLLLGVRLLLCAGLLLSLGLLLRASLLFLLACLARRTGGASMDANLVLLEENARLAGRIAAAHAAL